MKHTREAIMIKSVRIIGIAAFSASIFSSIPASAIEIVHTHIDDRGNLVLDIADDPPPVPLLNYHARTRASATYVCADFANRPHYLLTTRKVESIVDERALLAVGAGGGIRGLMLLPLPRERVNLACPRGFSAKIASLVYSQIEVRNAFGQIAYARDDARVFIQLDF
jgi:hypothetical protein